MAAMRDDNYTAHQQNEQSSGYIERQMSRKVSIFKILTVILSLIVAWICLGAFVLGVTYIGGKQLSVVCAINLALSVIDIGMGNIFTTICNAVICIFYIIFLVMLVINAIGATGKFFKVLSRSMAEKSRAAKNGACLDVYRAGASSMYKLVCFIGIVYLITGEALRTVSLWVIGASVLFLLLGTLLMALPDRYELFECGGSQARAWQYFAVAVLRRVVLLVFAVSIALFLFEPTLSQIYLSVRGLLGGYFADFKDFFNIAVGTLAINLLLLIAMISFLSALRVIFVNYTGIYSTEEVPDRILKNACIRILVLVIIVAAVLCLSQIMSYDMQAELTPELAMNWFNLLKGRQIPVILLAVAGIVVASGVFNNNAGKI